MEFFFFLEEISGKKKRGVGMKMGHIADQIFSRLRGRRGVTANDVGVHGHGRAVCAVGTFTENESDFK